MSESAKRPKAYGDFVARYPALGRAWETMGEASREGPLDDKTARLIKLGLSIGAMREGAVHSGVRTALAAGATRAEIEQVIALAASTLGMPATVAVFCWIRDHFDDA